MQTWLDIVVIAFTAQLLVLPGEKAQVVIAGLATRYSPAVVVAGAGTAFAGWTALEIWLGEALQGMLPTAVLDLGTAALFAVFGVWLLYASRAGTRKPAVTDGGHWSQQTWVSEYVPESATGFLPAFSMMAVGEFGDKTQLVTISLAATYAAGSAIWVGEMLAILPVSLVNAYFFHRFSHRVDVRWFHRISATIFFVFALDIVATYTLGHGFLPIG